MVRNKGFTIIEILAVFAVITVVSAIAVPKIINTVSNARKLKILQDMEHISSALQRYCTEQEILVVNSEACELNGLSIDGGEWHGANDDLQSETIQAALERYVEGNIDKHFSITITVDDDNWLTSKGYGCVSIWYPSVKEDGSRHYAGNISPADFNKNVFTQADWEGFMNQQKMRYNDFIFDIDADGADDSEDFLVSNTYFKLNSTHSHIASSTGLIEGGNDDDTLYGTPNVDEMYGYGGHDIIYGKQSNDIIYGGQGNDLIYGGLGNDLIDGGTGVDTAVYTQPLTEYTITGSGPYTIAGPDGTDTLIDIEYLSFDGISYSIDDVSNNNNVINGSNNGEYLAGTPDEDTINGFGGNDTIEGFASNDIIDGGTGDDTAIFSGYWVYYTITGNEPKIIAGPDGTDTLISIENLKFEDMEITIEEFEEEIDELINAGESGGSPFKADIFLAGDGINYIWTLNLFGDIDTIVFNGAFEDYTINEDWWWNSVSDNKGNITYFSSWSKTKLQFTDQVYYID